MDEHNSYPDSLSRRYPGIFWLLRMTTYAKWETFSEEGEINAKVVKDQKTTFLYKNRKKQLKDFLALLDKENTELIYLYGLGLGYHALALFDWLESSPRKSVVIFEKDLGVIEAFSTMPWSEKVLSHPRIHLRKGSSEKDFVHLAKEFPADKIQIFPLSSSIKGSFQKLELLLKRRTVAEHAVFIENLYPQRLFHNLLSNFIRMGDAFFVNQWKDQFKNKPAVICGAGPSLTQSIPVLKTLQNKALLLAGGSTIAALSNQGLVPHLGMALDPNEDEHIRIKNSVAFETPLLYGNRLLASIFSTTNSPGGYLASHTGGPLEVWLEKALGLKGEIIGENLSTESFSVTTLALSLAQFLGCNPIIFCGVDLAFTGNKNYAEGVLVEEKEKKQPEERIVGKDRHGKKIDTLLKWVMEADALSEFAKVHPEIQFYNCTEGGIAIPGVPYHSLEQLAKEDLQSTFDFTGYLHLLEQQHNLKSVKPLIEEELNKFIKSLKNCESILVRMVQILEEEQKRETGPLDNPLVFLLEEDMKEELAYQHFLYTIPSSITLWMNRFYLDSASQDYRYHYLERKKTIWNVCRQAAKECLELTSNVVFSELVSQSTHTNP